MKIDINKKYRSSTSEEVRIYSVDAGGEDFIGVLNFKMGAYESHILQLMKKLSKEKK